MTETWKERLGSQLGEPLANEIDIFEKQIELRRQGKLDEAVFAETRLRRGVYGQRYDNGQRHDGVASRVLDFPNADARKGPGTLFDAPGMQRIKIPFGLVTPDQLDVLADLAEEYSDEIVHITTRQDVQLHFLHIDDTPTLMRRLAAVGITTREACGNTVRNVTACQFAGVCQDETFDVSPYAEALTNYLLGHEDTQNFGRKFKVAFSGCADQACGLVTIHDLGLVAKVQDGKRGFEFYVGGGLGTVPFTAKLFDSFLPEEELLPMSLAVCRVFTQLGEKRNRARARLKFVIKKLGFDSFKERVLEERRTMAAGKPDPRWTSYLQDVERWEETPLKPASSLVRRTSDTPFDQWRATNARPQKQAGYSTVTVKCPLGDLSSRQTRAVADLARTYTRGTVRLTVEQNFVLRWVSDADLQALYEGLVAIGLGEAGAGTIVDVTACPGTDTCKLGIASSRGLAAELGERLAAKNAHLDEAIAGLHIKVSGCFNSCGQHHIADLGFYGVSRKVGSYTVPHFQAVLGGQWTENAKSYGLAMGALPSKNIPRVVDRITDFYVAGRERAESFQDFIRRVGKKKVRDELEDLFTVPAYEQDKSFYRDWADAREFTIGDLGIGECAGEVVSQAQFGLAASERQAFEAQEFLEQGKARQAADRSIAAMLAAARALAREITPDLSDDPDAVVAAFKQHFFDTKLFFDPFAGAKFAMYLLHAHARAETPDDAESARQCIEEAQLFIEAAHSCYGRMVDG